MEVALACGAVRRAAVPLRGLLPALSRSSPNYATVIKKRYLGKRCQKAVENVNEEIASELIEAGCLQPDGDRQFND